MPDYSLNWTARPVLYKGDKGINDAAHPAEAEDLSSSSLPLLDRARKRQSQQRINAVGLDARGVTWYNALLTVTPHDWEGVWDIPLQYIYKYIYIVKEKWTYPRKKRDRVCLARKSENGRANVF